MPVRYSATISKVIEKYYDCISKVKETESANFSTLVESHSATGSKDTESLSFIVGKVTLKFVLIEPNSAAVIKCTETISSK